jgi:hypothetical protein
MSAFVLVLAAGMALRSGPEAVSIEAEDWLDLRGEWEGPSGWARRLVRSGCGAGS